MNCFACILLTLLRLCCGVRKPVRWQRLAFFQLGAEFFNDVSALRIAIGDVEGLREEWQPRRENDQYDRAAQPLTGMGVSISVHGVDVKR